MTVDDRAKWGKYGLYNNNGLLFCKPCGKEGDYLRNDSIQHHILTDLHDCNCARHVRCGAPYVLAPGYEGYEERRKQQAQKKQERTKKRRVSGREVGREKE